MTKPLLTGALWEIIQPLLPPEKARPKGVWPQFLDRLALTGILFVARTGTAWELLPPELRMREWQDVLAPPSGLASRRYLEKDWKKLLDELGLADKIDWSKAVVDSSSVRALFYGGENWPESQRSREKWR